MEFTKDIHFSDNLKERQKVKITYSGELFKNNSDSVTIVYGYGENWEHTTEQEMEKTEGGFTADIEIKDFFDKFNFCFRNSNYMWDNNNNCNYIADISPLCLEDLLDPQEEVNESLIIELLDNLLNENIDYAKEETKNEEDNKQQILEDILTEQTLEENEFIWTENFDMNKLVENILNPVVNCEPLEETTENFEENIISDSVSVIETIPEPNNIFDELFEDDGNVTLAETMDEIAENIEELYKEEPKENIEYFSESTIKEDSKTEYFAESTIDENYIEPVEPSLLENLDNNTTSLITTVSSEDKYLVSPRQLSRFYMIKKKVKIALYKLFVAIPKILSGEYDKSKE